MPLDAMARDDRAEGAGASLGPSGATGVARCPRCAQPMRGNSVHGHLACERCGANVAECCDGERANCLPVETN